MNTSINCKISLSKKLRAWLGKEGSITLTTSGLVDGKGVGVLSLVSDNDITVELDTTETSIQLTPMEMTDEVPTNATTSHANLFSSVEGGKQKAISKVVSKIAATQAPEKGKEGTAIKETVETPQAFESLKDPECKNWISNMQEFVTAINAARGKKSDVDVTIARNKLEEAALQEQRDKDEAIDTPAWVVNNKGGILIINDLGITLLPNAPMDLSNFSAKRIAASRDLRELLKSGYLEFISPEERDQYIMEGMPEETVGSLEVFSNHEEAEAAITNNRKHAVINETDAMDLEADDLERPTEEESMMLDLTQAMPTNKTKTAQASKPVENRRSSHGGKQRANDMMDLTARAKAPKAPTLRKKF